MPRPVGFTKDNLLLVCISFLLQKVLNKCLKKVQIRITPTDAIECVKLPFCSKQLAFKRICSHLSCKLGCKLSYKMKNNRKYDGSTCQTKTVR